MSLGPNSHPLQLYTTKDQHGQMLTTGNQKTPHESSCHPRSPKERTKGGILDTIDERETQQELDQD